MPTAPVPVAPEIFTLNPNHPDVALATISRYIIASINDLRDNTVSVEDLAIGMAALAQLASTFFSALDSSVADRKQLNDRTAVIEAKTTGQDTGLATEVTRAKAAEKVTADALAALATRVAALEARTLRGTTGTGTLSSLVGGNTSLTVTLKTPMPSADYIALPVIDATSGVNLTTVTATVTAKTASTVTVRIANSGIGLLQTASVTVIAVQLA